MAREPSSLEDFVYGSKTGMPFIPGGMENAFVDRNSFSNLTPEDIEKG